MSINGAGKCDKCGAHNDYCTLITATGIEIDCRDLQIRNGIPKSFYSDLARDLQNAEQNACEHRNHNT